MELTWKTHGQWKLCSQIYPSKLDKDLMQWVVQLYWKKFVKDAQEEDYITISFGAFIEEEEAQAYHTQQLDVALTTEPVDYV